MGLLLSLLVAEKSGFQIADGAEPAGLKELSERITREALEALQKPNPEGTAVGTIAAAGRK